MQPCFCCQKTQYVGQKSTTDTYGHYFRVCRQRLPHSAGDYLLLVCEARRLAKQWFIPMQSLLMIEPRTELDRCCSFACCHTHILTYWKFNKGRLPVPHRPNIRDLKRNYRCSRILRSADPPSGLAHRSNSTYRDGVEPG